MKNVSLLDSIYLSLKIDVFLQLFAFLIRNFKTTKNWFDILLLRVGLKKQSNAIFRNNKILKNVTLENFSVYRNIQETFLRNFNSNNGKFEIIYHSRKIILKGDEAPFQLSEIFLDESYSKLNPNGKTVVDVGANIGDSAIYFAVRGARHVYAFEPFEYVLNTARNNIRLNKLEKNITLIQAAVGEKEGSITLNPEDHSSGGSDLKPSNCGVPIDVLTLENIVDKFKIQNGILKVDCEGSEYGILLPAKEETLRKFDEIFLEYHYGYSNLVQKLKNSGFTIQKIGPPRSTYNRNATNPHMIVGLIYAKRI